MKYVPPKFERLSDMAAIDVGRLTEDESRKILENIRWPNGITCSHCGSVKVTRLPASEKVRDGLIQCNSCRNQFTVTHGTVMHGSHITLRQWIQAFHSMCSHKKGVSALQLQRNLGLGSYRSAWHLAHRIRLAMKIDPLASKLEGIVEVDETYVGGKPRRGGRKKNGEKFPTRKRGRGTTKAPVLVLVERGGQAKSMPIKRVNGDTLKAIIREKVAQESTIMTDEAGGYYGIGPDFKGGHHIVKHAQGEYARGEANTNTAESYFAILKRGVHGTFHHISKQHLDRYCDEFAFRWNNRVLKDGERAVEAIKGMAGKRLVYKG